MCWRCEQGKSVLIPSGPNIGQRHLFAILINPVQVQGYGKRPHVLMACMCSVKDGMPFDDACILEVGDHPFVQHQSYIDYRFCELRPADEIEAKVQEGTLVPHGDCSIALLRRIIASADASKRISREMKKFLRSVDLPPLP
jgi:hypothetical protein